MLWDLLDYGIFGLLIFLSIIVLGLTLERIYIYAKIDIYCYTDKELLEIELTKNLTLIATVASNAPYIGLLGTIGGIMVTFIDIGNGNSISTQNIMTGLAIALRATALGLLVAIPSIVSYNLLLRKVEVLLSKWDLLKKHEKLTANEN